MFKSVAEAWNSYFSEEEKEEEDSKVMAVLETLAILLLVGPTLFFITLVYVLAALGKSLGFRKIYVQLLLFIFDYGRERIERFQTKTAKNVEEEEEVEEDDSESCESRNSPMTQSFVGELPADTEKVKDEDDGVEGKLIEGGDAKKTSEEKKKDQNQNHHGKSIDLADHDEKFDFQDTFDFIKSGIGAIVNDQVTQRFASEELRSWNLLTRTNRKYEFISWRLSMIWVFGFFLRYCLLLPFRVLICFLGTITLTVLTFFIGLLPQCKLRRRLNDYASKFSFRLLSRAFSAIVTYHCEENRPTKNGICVANHTSPIDVVLLACDSTYALIGQRHGGFLGLLQRALGRASSHIWFERSEMKDREAVAKRLRKHVEDETTSPILIFPEGTCINNSAVMQFKKGSFEVGGVIYPVAIKYDPRFGDPFWDSSQYSMLQYLYMMMTSWAIVSDVWYLPPMTRKPGESSIDFANRVKAEIARAGGLIELDWDGQLKRSPAKKEWKEQKQVEYAKKFALQPRHIVNGEENPNPST